MMRISITISLLILIVAALLAWRDHLELTELRAEKTKLHAEARALEIPQVNSPHTHPRTKRERADKIAEARQTALDIIGLAKEMQRLKESGEEADTAMRDRIMELMERIRSMDSDQLLTLIEEFRIAEDLDDPSRRMLLIISTDVLTDRNPRAALDQLTKNGDTHIAPHNRENLILKSLTNWGETDAIGALAWFRANPISFMPDSSMEIALVEGVARTNLKLAVGLIGELAISDAGAALGTIASKLRNPADQTEMLGMLRDSTSPFTDHEVDLALANLALGVAKGSHEEGVRWIEENNLTEREVDQMIHGITHHAGNDDKGNWIEWMGDNLPAETRDQRIETAIAHWTANDHRAAGEWLAALPDGPAKSPAVAAFAITVAPHDPQVAMQWALTLPPGEKRNQTLKAITGEDPTE